MMNLGAGQQQTGIYRCSGGDCPHELRVDQSQAAIAAIRLRVIM